MNSWVRGSDILQIPVPLRRHHARYSAAAARTSASEDDEFDESNGAGACASERAHGFYPIPETARNTTKDLTGQNKAGGFTRTYGWGKRSTAVRRRAATMRKLRCSSGSTGSSGEAVGARSRD